MAKRFVDISAGLKAGIASDPPPMLPKITYSDHKQGAETFVKQFPGLRVDQLPEGMGAAVETVTISTHNGHPPRCAVSFPSTG